MSRLALVPSWYRRPTAVRRLDPFDALESEFSGLWSSFFGENNPWTVRSSAGYLPRLNLEETEDSIRLSVELPGVDEKDISLSLSDSGEALTIKGEKKETLTGENEAEGRVRTERVYGSFQRSIELPAPVEADRAEAVLKNGVLQVVLPKRNPEAQVRTIEVKAA